MDLTLYEYIDYINHLFLQEMVDFDYKDADSTGDALIVIGE